MILNPYTTVTYSSGSSRSVDISSVPVYHPDHVYSTGYDRIVPVLTPSADPVYYWSCLTHFYHFYFGPKSMTGAGLCRIRDPYSTASYSLMLHSFGDGCIYPHHDDMYVVDDDTVRYEYYDYDAHLDFKVCNNMIHKALYFLKRPKTNTVSFALSRGGGSIYIDSETSVIYGTKDMRSLFRLDTPVAYDSSDGLPTYITPTVSIYWGNNNKSLLIINLTLDNEWLDNAVYPIVIDPSIVITSTEANTYHCRILEAIPTGNYHDAFLSAVNLSGQRTPSMLKFLGLAGVIDGMLINSALLSLTCSYLGGRNLPSLQCDRVTRAWIETQATYNKYATASPWTTPGCNGVPSDRAGTLSPSVTCVPTPGVVTQLDVTDITQAWASDMSTHHGYIILPPSNLSYVHFASPSYSYTSGYTPVLSVSYDVISTRRYVPIAYGIGGMKDNIIGG